MVPSTVTCRSSIDSSNADWVFGDARLISSPTTMFAKTGPGLNSKFAALLVVGAHPGHVAGQQVRRELHPAHGAVDGPRQRLGQHGLADAGDVLDEQVPLREQDGEGQPDHVGLPVDHGLHRRAYPLGNGNEILKVPFTLPPRVHYQRASSIGLAKLPA